jgi:hypothetical protein
MSARNPKSFPRRGPILSAPIRVDVRLTSNEGFTKRFGTWEEVTAWLASPGFLKGTPAVTSIRIVHQRVQSGGVP